MTPAIIVRERDLPRKYWWAALVLILAVGAWLTLPFLQDGRDGARREARLAASEQSLDVLDAISSARAPGAPVNDAGGAVGARVGRSPAGGTAGPSADSTGPGGAPGTSSHRGAAAAGISGPGGAPGGGSGSLGEALQRVARSGQKPGDKGWGGETPQAGFTRPKAGFGALSGLGFGGSGGGGGSASQVSALTPFGFGRSHPGESPSPGVQGGGAPGGSPAPRRAGKNRAFEELRGARAVAGQAASSAVAERSAGLAGHSYDASVMGPALSAAGASGALISGFDASPDNLKANDPRVQQRELIPPKPPEPKKVEDKKLEMEKMMTQMLLQAVIGGIMGPISQSIGGGIMGSFGLGATTPLP